MSRDSVFDDLAPTYDDDFSARLPALWLRQHVRETVKSVLPPTGRLLDIGCGTGEDACWFAELGYDVDATDVSPGMLEQASARLRSSEPEVRSRIAIRVLDAATPPADESGIDGPYDCVYSNFGALNCVQDTGVLFRWIDRVLKPRGSVVLTIMGRCCAWETFGFAIKGDFARATRRWNGSDEFVVNDVRQPVWYHSVGEICKTAAPVFEIVDAVGVGVFLPSTEFFAVCENRPRLFRTLCRLDKKLSMRWPFNRVGDHYLVVMRRSA